MPAGDSVGEVLCVFVLTEGDLRLDAEDAAFGGHEKRLDVTTVLAVVDLRELFPDRAVFDLLREAFEDDGFIGFFGADDNVRVRGDVFRFTSARAGAEPEGILPPDAPDQHEVRAAAGARGGDPIVVGFLEAFEGPGPGLEASGSFRRFFKSVGPVRAACLRLDHEGSLVGVNLRGGFYQAGHEDEESYILVEARRLIA